MNYKALSYILFYLLIINILSIAVTIADKIKAKKHKWRIPERMLFILSGIGGAATMLLTMLLIHHKTKQKRFMLTLPIMIIIQAGIIYWFTNAYILI